MAKALINNVNNFKLSNYKCLTISRPDELGCIYWPVVMQRVAKHLYRSSNPLD